MTNETKIFKKLRIVFDVDDVLVPFTKEICKLCKKKFNKDFDYKDVIWGFKNWASEEIVYVESLFCNDEFIASLPMIRGAKKAVEWAVERGHEVLFCSSTYSNVMTTRALYLINKFKGIHPRNIILTGRKDVVRCDLAFDDAEHNLVSSIAAIPVAVTSPWNAHLKGVVRANGPEDYINIIKLAEQGYTKHEILAMQQAKYEGESPCCVVLVGPSGAGKTTVAEYLINNYSDRFEKVITDTTRQPREGEENGVHYNFKTKEQFEALIKAEGYVEYSTYADKMYGSSKAAIDSILAKGKCPLLVMDANGAKAIAKAYPNNAFSVFLERTKEDLIASILERSVPQEDKINRIIQLEKDFQTANVCTYLVKNNKTVKDAAEAVMNFIP